VALALVMMAGTGSHLLVHGPWALEAIDSLFALALFAVLIVWLRLNEVPLARLNEPDAGVGRPFVRVVRSRHTEPAGDVNHRIIRLDPDDRVILPYDFR
jgi:hypothetical protein